ncbi:MAG: hypothetical protein J5379_01390 [Clostridiales bacterium]|nr:hypothetical protein [Clostridiales bacterium]
MKKHDQLGIFDKVYGREIGRVFISALMTLLFMLAVSFYAPRVFFINDDENIMYTLSGYYTYGVPYDHPFVNYCLSLLLRGMYRLFPSVQWYGVFHVSVLYLSMVVIFKTVLKKSYRNKLPLFFPCIVNTLLFAGLYLFPSTLMQFTTTAAFAGAAASVLLWGIDFTKDRPRTIHIDLIVSVIFLVLSYLHRKNTGYVSICFYCGTVSFILLRLFVLKRANKAKSEISNNTVSFKQNLIRVLVTFVAAMLVIVLAIFIDSRARSSNEWDYYYEYDTARFHVTDYPHDSYDSNPELYEEIGWSPELYELTGKSWWFFMDERINKDTFEKISDTGFYSEDYSSVKSALKVGYELFRDDKVARSIMISAFVLGIMMLVSTIVCLIKKKNIVDILYGDAMLGGALILCLFLCYRQRFPLRALHTIMIPLISIAAVVLVSLFKRKKGKLSVFIHIFIYVVALVFIIGLGYFNLKQARKQGQSKESLSKYTLSIEEYAIEHPENKYVYDVSLTFRYLPFTVYEDEYPSNLMFWGGMGWNSPAFFEQVRQNGLEDLYSDNLFLDDVYYITRDSYVAGGRTIRDRLEAYLDATYGDCDFETVDDLGNGIMVYKIHHYSE